MVMFKEFKIKGYQKKKITTIMERRSERVNHVKDREARFKKLTYNGNKNMQAMVRDRREWRKTIGRPVHNGL